MSVTGSRIKKLRYEKDMLVELIDKVIELSEIRRTR